MTTTPNHLIKLAKELVNISASTYGSAGVMIYNDGSGHVKDGYNTRLFGFNSLQEGREKLQELLDSHKQVVVKLNDEYDGVVKSDHVLVGCQQIPFEAVRKLFEALPTNSRIGSTVEFRDVKVGEKIKWPSSRTVYTRLESKDGDNCLEYSSPSVGAVVKTYYNLQSTTPVEIVG